MYSCNFIGCHMYNSCNCIGYHNSCEYITDILLIYGTDILYLYYIRWNCFCTDTTEIVLDDYTFFIVLDTDSFCILWSQSIKNSFGLHFTSSYLLSDSFSVQNVLITTLFILQMELTHHVIVVKMTRTSFALVIFSVKQCINTNVYKYWNNFVFKKITKVRYWK